MMCDSQVYLAAHIGAAGCCRWAQDAVVLLGALLDAAALQRGRGDAAHAWLLGVSSREQPCQQRGRPALPPAPACAALQVMCLQQMPAV